MKKRLRTSSEDGQKPAARVALSHAAAILEEAQRHADGLQHNEDPEALHDFRVAIRRMRTYIQAYLPHLPFTKGDLRNLKRIAILTNPARDSEVAQAWVSDYLEHHRQRQTALTPLQELLQQETERNYRQVYNEALQSWPKLEQQLQKRLGEKTDKTGHSYDQATADIMQNYLADLEQWHNTAMKGWSPTALHKTRIRIKRIRYLLEPLCQRINGGIELIAALKAGQDHLGQLHDQYLLLERLPGDFGTLAVQRSDRACVQQLQHRESPPAADQIRRSDNLPHQLQLLYALQLQTDEHEKWIRGHYFPDTLSGIIEWLKLTAVELAR